MKKTYEGLEMEVIRFSTEDIITTSEAATNNEQVQTPTQTTTQTATQESTPAQEPTQTNGIFNYGPGEAPRSESHQLTPAGDYHGYPSFTDENNNAWHYDKGEYWLILP